MYGSTPVCFMAAMGLKKPIVLLLLEGERVLTGHSSRLADSGRAVQQETPKFSKNMFTPLHAAVGADNIEMVDFLITLERKELKKIMESLGEDPESDRCKKLLKNNLVCRMDHSVPTLDLHDCERANRRCAEGPRRRRSSADGLRLRCTGRGDARLRDAARKRATRSSCAP